MVDSALGAEGRDKPNTGRPLILTLSVDLFST